MISIYGFVVCLTAFGDVARTSEKICTYFEISAASVEEGTKQEMSFCILSLVYFAY